LLANRKIFFDKWPVQNMCHGEFIDISQSPQFFIKFLPAPTPMQTIVCWVVISKLIIVHDDGMPEEEENSKDYMAMHVYESPVEGQRIVRDKKALVRSVYSPE